MLAAARDGSNRAWAALLERLDPSGRLLAHLVLGGLDVDATLHSAYVRAYRARRKGPDDAVAMVLNHVWIACGHEVRRRQRRQAPAPGRRPQPDPRTSRLGSSTDARTLADLRPEERAVWALIDRAELPAASVAAALGVDERVITGVAERVALALEDARAGSLGADPDGTAESDEAAADPTTGRGEIDGRPETDEDTTSEDLVAEGGDPDPDPAPDDDDRHPGGRATEEHGRGDDLVADERRETRSTGARRSSLHEVIDLSDAAEADAALDAAATTAAAGPAELEAADDFDDAAEADDSDEGSLDPEPATPAFWQELGRRLQAERDAVAAAPPPSLPDPEGPSPALTPAQVPPGGVPTRTPRRVRRRRSDVVEEAGRSRAVRSWPGLLVRAAAILVVAAVLGLVVYALYNAASRARSPVRGNSTADLGQQSMGVLADAGTWSATIERSAVGDAGEPTEATLTIQAAEDGSFRFTDASISRLTTYDARFGVVRDTLAGFPPRNDEGVAPGGPDPSPPRADLPLDDLATAARVLSTQDDVEPEQLEINGRTLWELTGPLDDATELTYLVDTETLLPTRITWTRDGATIRELRFGDVALGGGADFTQDIPPDVAPTVLGFQPVQLGEVQGRIGMAPLTPDFLPGEPDGFEFTGAYVDEAAMIASLRYADGPQQMIITVRPSPVPPGQTWPDPFDRSGQSVTPEEVMLTSGAFRDVPALMVSQGTALPSLWGTDGERAFTVAGDLSPDDLQRVAASLG